MQSFESNASQDQRPNMETSRSTADRQYVYHEHYRSPSQSGPAQSVTDESRRDVAASTIGNAEQMPTKSGAKNAATDRLATDLSAFNAVAEQLRKSFEPASDFKSKCGQAFELANELFVNAPTWVCFYRELMGGRGFITALFPEDDEFGNFLRTEEYHQIQMMLTALRSRDIPENDPNDPQRMITVRLPKSLHEAMCEEANRLNISVNRLCISRMLQLLDPKMIPETQSKPRGRKPRLRSKS